jgi:quercetin dioxygenase-like cupin family protein
MVGAAQFRNRREVEPAERSDSAEVRRLVGGGRLALTEYVVEAGFETGGGSQEQDKVGYVVRGSVEITTDTGAQLVEAGGGYAIPAGVQHRFRVVEDALIVQVVGQVDGG